MRLFKRRPRTVVVINVYSSSSSTPQEIATAVTRRLSQQRLA